MKPEELRIGNCINIIGIVPTQATAKHILLIAEGDDQYAPIPLTEEWLIKFGFEKGYETFTINLGDSKYGWSGGSIEYIPKDNKCAIWSGLGSWEDYGFTADIKYVHQIQNLYFALTGEELTIKDI